MWNTWRRSWEHWGKCQASWGKTVLIPCFGLTHTWGLFLHHSIIVVGCICSIGKECIQSLSPVFQRVIEHNAVSWARLKLLLGSDAFKRYCLISCEGLVMRAFILIWSSSVRATWKSWTLRAEHSGGKNPWPQQPASLQKSGAKLLMSWRYATHCNLFIL